MLERRNVLIDESGHFQYRLKPELQRFNRLYLKYWPDIAGFIRSPGMEEVEVTFADEATGTIINDQSFADGFLQCVIL